MKAQASEDPLEKVERNRKSFKKVHRMLCWSLPVTALFVVGDLVRYVERGLPEIDPASPEMGLALESHPAIPALRFPQGLFQVSEPVKPQLTAAVVAQQMAWVLKGVLMKPEKRAFLFNEDNGQGVWVREKEQLEGSVVHEIHSRSLILTREGKAHELRM